MNVLVVGGSGFVGSHLEEADFILVMILGVILTLVFLNATKIAMGANESPAAWTPACRSPAPSKPSTWHRSAEEPPGGQVAGRLQFERDDYLVSPEYQAPRRFFATTGISVERDGLNRSEDLTLAARNALLNMIDHLVAELPRLARDVGVSCPGEADPV
jgi:hypothetical protein